MYSREGKRDIKTQGKGAKAGNIETGDLVLRQLAACGVGPDLAETLEAG